LLGNRLVGARHGRLCNARLVSGFSKKGMMEVVGGSVRMIVKVFIGWRYVDIWGTCI
jgi:hypothetical protein